METIKAKISGLTCVACAKLCQLKIGKIGGVQAVKVDQNTGDTTIIANRIIDQSEMAQVLSDTEYKINLPK
ncbi:MAG: heavy metal-associated domain-containing protein [Patescibacteria group bacterium]